VTLLVSNRGMLESSKQVLAVSEECVIPSGVAALQREVAGNSLVPVQSSQVKNKKPDKGDTIFVTQLIRLRSIICAQPHEGGPYFCDPTDKTKVEHLCPAP